jgi:hypothetical protein
MVLFSDMNLKFTRFPARSVAAATFAFYVADPSALFTPSSRRLRRGGRTHIE